MMNPNFGNGGPWQPRMQSPYYGDRIGSPPFIGPSFSGNQQPFRGPSWGLNQPQPHQPYHNYHNRVNFNNNVRHRYGNPGPSRSNSYHGHGSQSNRDVCFICRDALQNCNERGIHLCDGGHTCDTCLKEAQKEAEITHDLSQEEIDARLESLLQEIKGCIQNKYQSVSESLEQFVTNRINEINTIHKNVTEDRAVLEKLKTELETRTQELEKKEQKLREKEKQQQKDRQKFDKEIQKEKEEICRQWQQLRDELTRMEEMHKVQEGRIKLDVGGNIYTTSKLTLIRDKESMLAAMFSGRHEVKMESDGTVFIDRDGTHFRYILNYLRDGGVNLDSLPRNRQVLRELRNEAIYYQLHGLLHQIEKLM